MPHKHKHGKKKEKIVAVPQDVLAGAKMAKLLTISEGVKKMLEGLELDLTDPNLVGTPIRVAESLVEMCQGMFDTKARLADIMSTKFPADGYDEMITERRIITSGVCPHHFLPIRYRMAIAYVPNKAYYVVGLSKLARVAELLSARPIMQEQLVVDIADAIDEYLKPQGVGVAAVGIHDCMSCRGVKQRESDAVTTKLTGCFREAATRQEFLAVSGLFHVHS